jgi:hypothetical protein
MIVTCNGFSIPYAASHESNIHAETYMPAFPPTARSGQLLSTPLDKPYDGSEILGLKDHDHGAV